MKFVKGVKPIDETRGLENVNHSVEQQDGYIQIEIDNPSSAIRSMLIARGFAER